MQKIEIKHVKQLLDDAGVENHINDLSSKSGAHLYAHNGNQPMWFGQRAYGIVLFIKNGKYADGNNKMKSVKILTIEQAKKVVAQIKKSETVPVVAKVKTTVPKVVTTKPTKVTIDENFDGETLVIETKEGITERLSSEFYVVVDEPVTQTQAPSELITLINSVPKSKQPVVKEALMQLVSALCKVEA